MHLAVTPDREVAAHVQVKVLTNVWGNPRLLLLNGTRPGKVLPTVHAVNPELYHAFLVPLIRLSKPLSSVFNGLSPYSIFFPCNMKPPRGGITRFTLMKLKIRGRLSFTCTWMSTCPPAYHSPSRASSISSRVTPKAKPFEVYPAM